MDNNLLKFSFYKDCFPKPRSVKLKAPKCISEESVEMKPMRSEVNLKILESQVEKLVRVVFEEMDTHIIE